MNKPGFKYRNFKKKPDDPYEEVTIKLPKFMLQMVKDHSTAVKLPLGRIIGYAVDNELSKEKPFTFDTETPDTVYIPDAYSEESARIEKFLMKFPRGIGLDAMLLFRWGMGIPDRTSFLLGFRELWMSKKVEFHHVKKLFEHPADYEFVFLTRPPDRMTAKGNKRLSELQDAQRAKDLEIAKLKAENAKLRGNK